jgi:hypothetical protein
MIGAQPATTHTAIGRGVSAEGRCSAAGRYDMVAGAEAARLRGEVLTTEGEWALKTNKPI